MVVLIRTVELNDMNAVDWSSANIQPVEEKQSGERFHQWKEPWILRQFAEPFHRVSMIDPVRFVLETLGSVTITAVRERESLETTLGDWYSSHRQEGWYLKDFHVNRESRSYGIDPIFATPICFPDWLNQYYQDHCDIPELDFQFLYWGNRGTRTEFHQDVLGSYSWSFNLHGSKRWRFFITNSDGSLIVRDCVQNAGDMVFVPSRCYHTVENLDDDTISLNQNWFNGTNIENVIHCIQEDMRTVRNELKLFEVEFATPEEERDTISRIVRANNCLNLDTLSEIVTRFGDADTCTQLLDMIANHP
jgi:hypothetical protein